MRETGFEFTVEKPDVDESFPPDLPPDQVARYLAAKKAEYFRLKMRDQIIITADTVVILKNRILNKPTDRMDAIGMLTALAGNTHSVMTGVSIFSKEKEENFDETTEVTFENLSDEEIEFYIDHFKPFDKAGAYGAQDCLPIGMNPCSQEEITFLKEINRPDLLQKTITRPHGGQSIAVIKKISGSYFNVMGLPIHIVHGHLKKWL
jgi:septum formation protein